MCNRRAQAQFGVLLIGVLVSNRASVGLGKVLCRPRWPASVQPELELRILGRPVMSPYRTAYDPAGCSVPTPDSPSPRPSSSSAAGWSAGLAEAGLEVVLVERAQLASGSTSRAAGGVRTQFSDVLNIEIAKRSMAAFRDFARRPGWEIDFKHVGYLFVLNRTDDVAAFEASIALQNECGLASRLLTADQARELCPLLAGEDILAGAFSPGDGHATPEGVVQGYAAGARTHGARIRTGCEVLGVSVAAGEITEVVTSQGSIATSVVICAAGAWSRSCGAMVGVQLPVMPLRRQILFTDAIDGLPADLPMTIDFESSFYFHREGPGLLLGMSDENERPGFSVETTDDWIPG